MDEGVHKIGEDEISKDSGVWEMVIPEEVQCIEERKSPVTMIWVSVTPVQARIR